MANAQIGNGLGVSQPGPTDAKLAEITADGANTVTVAAADLRKFRVGQQINVRVKATGAMLGATTRTITGITSAGVITYDGADMASVAGTHAIYAAGAATVGVSSTGTDGVVNLNGGPSVRSGAADADMETIQGLRTALAATHSSAVLDTMTENDMKFALRTIRNPVGVRGY